MINEDINNLSDEENFGLELIKKSTSRSSNHNSDDAVAFIKMLNTLELDELKAGIYMMASDDEDGFAFNAGFYGSINELKSFAIFLTAKIHALEETGIDENETVH